ncbi:unnamed protein product [Arctia plantaginis]|uniref:F-box/SPRY domain-containing protein 1 n=1 Tax=Arctia plantaginis TaxID=874455 RepID=A0A8S1BG53_ARCPL|nr:unnamed protein product [Arctia plantaginis]
MNESESYEIGEVIPDLVLETIFSYLGLRDLQNCSLVCKRWYEILSGENSVVWRSLCIQKLSQEVRQCNLLSTVPTYKSKLRAHLHAWNPRDCSHNIFVTLNDFVLHRYPVGQSSDACRAKIGFNHGKHAWEVIWRGPLGTVAVVGISTKEAPLQCSGYVGLLGSDTKGWGWNIVDNHLLHNGASLGRYPLLANFPKYKSGELIKVILDCEERSLAFERNGQFLGVAFRGLPREVKLYPTVSAVFGGTAVAMVYLGPPMDGCG